MSTHCTIMHQLSDGSVRYIYCHFDGYPRHMVPTLTTHYATEDQVRDLIALGDLSFCGSPAETIAYHRDRGEDLHISEAPSADDPDMYVEEFAYLFRDGQWFMNTYRDREWKAV